VLRGYELLADLIQQGVDRTPDDWRLNLVQAAAWYDWAEFQYGKKVDLAIYVEKRDRALTTFQRAAQLYAEKLPTLEKKDHTPLVYQQWLNANLGASDLAYVTRQQEPTAGNLELIRKAILALPNGAADDHFTQLAKAVTSSGDSLPAHLKAGYMRAALKITGDRKEAEEIRKLVTYYDGLLREIEVSVRVDGDTSVGHTEPFGFFLSIRHTPSWSARVRAHFPSICATRHRTPTTSIRSALRRSIIATNWRSSSARKLTENFEVVSLTFTMKRSSRAAMDAMAGARRRSSMRWSRRRTHLQIAFQRCGSMWSFATSTAQWCCLWNRLRS
jgi:hypothetical protein